MSPIAARPIVFARNRDHRIVAGFPLRPGERPGTSRCLVWHRGFSPAQRESSERHGITELELLALLGPPDEETHFSRAFL